MSKPFQFKKFSVAQDKTAMKIGTDGVLLGAWIPISNESHILDIGTGTGVISLMMAQRSEVSKITAIEIEENAYKQAVDNFKQAPWSNRLQAIQTSLQDFSFNQTFDLIVSNPPYYTSTNKNESKEKALARHVDNLSFQDLLSHTSQLLKNSGKAYFIIPFQEEISFLQKANIQGLYLEKITRVKGHKDAPIKRSLLCFSKNKIEDIDASELIIEVERHQYTPEYIRLVKDFYLKM